LSNTPARYTTEQEAFWAGSFGTDYIARNESAELLASNLAFFANALRQAGRIDSCVEFGANIGMNLRALKLLHPQMKQRGIEINAEAARRLAEFVGAENVHTGSLLDAPVAPVTPTVDLSLIKGVLIHLNPEVLQAAYAKLVQATHRFVLVAEYYNPAPVVIPYRGHTDRLFKRDFAGEMIEAFPALRLVDYGFAYRRDPAFPQDDITWFLMEKRST
jgi:pseudaminic acid biosynthesis-associated methylase